MSSDQAAGSTVSWVVGAAVTVTVAFLAGATNGSMPLAVIGAGTLGIVAGVLVRRPASRHRTTPDRRLTFRTPAQLRDAKVRLGAARQQHVQTLKEREAVRRRLATLRAKMQDVGLPAYGSRIATIDRGLATLDRQIGVIARLRDGYDRSIAMIDIELEAGAAAEDLGDDASSAIADAVFELGELESAQTELARQLEANVEVEELLRAR